MKNIVLIGGEGSISLIYTLMKESNNIFFISYNNLSGKIKELLKNIGLNITIIDFANKKSTKEEWAKIKKRINKVDLLINDLRIENYINRTLGVKNDLIKLRQSINFLHYSTKSVIPKMTPVKGKILNIINSLESLKSFNEITVEYELFKSAVEGFAEILVKENLHYDLNVDCLSFEITEDIKKKILSSNDNIQLKGKLIQKRFLDSSENEAVFYFKSINANYYVDPVMQMDGELSINF